MAEEIQVLNRIALSKLRYLDTSTAIISITDRSSEFAHLSIVDKQNLNGLLRVRFGDLEEGEEGCIQKLEAIQIAEFVRQYGHVVDKLIVSCDGGISRSAATAAAIASYLGLDDMSIWGNGKYCPNLTVYKLILATLFEDESVQIDTDKLNINIKLWKELNDMED